MATAGTSALRSFLVAVGSGAGLAIAIWRTVFDARRIADGLAVAPADRRLDDLVVDIASLVLLLGVCGLATSAALVAAVAWRARRTGRPVRRVTIAPAWWRALVLAACGGALVAPSAVAADAAAPSTRTVEGRDDLPRLTGLPLPDLPETPTRRPQEPESILVRPGDSLWTIARSVAPTDCTDAQIAIRVERLYAANRDVIGPDPDLILPGTRLNGGIR